MIAYLCCNVTSGQFSGEYAVRCKSQAGEFSLFAPKDCVKDVDDSAVGISDSCSALLRVEILESNGKSALVELPAFPFEFGQSVTVNCDQLQEED